MTTPHQIHSALAIAGSRMPNDVTMEENETFIAFAPEDWSSGTPEMLGSWRFGLPPALIPWSAISIPPGAYYALAVAHDFEDGVVVIVIDRDGRITLRVGEDGEVWVDVQLDDSAPDWARAARLLIGDLARFPELADASA